MEYSKGWDSKILNFYEILSWPLASVQHNCFLNLGIVDGAEEVNTDSNILHNWVANTQNLVL